jgi:hypothetical protein
MLKEAVVILCLAFAMVGATTFTWSTTNANAYMCSQKGITIASGVSTNVTCAQTEYPLIAGQALNTLNCSAGGTVVCFLYATFGRAGGSCGGDPFSDDPSGDFAFMPPAIGNAIIGLQTYSFNVTATTVNDVAVPNWNPSVTPASVKFKVLAACSVAQQASAGSVGVAFSIVVVAFVTLVACFANVWL